MSLVEMICLGLDAVIVTIFYKYYRDTTKSLKGLKDAPTFEISPDLTAEVRKCAQEFIPYAIIRGSVKAIEQPIISKNVPGMAAVIHESILREHKIQWSWASRWWREVKNDLSRTTNSVPFALSGDRGGALVEVLDATSARGLEMRTVFDEFEQSKTGFWDSLSRFFIGETTTGFQHIEAMLPEGSVLTGAGTLVLQQGRLCLQMPDNGMPFYLTQMTKGGLVKSLERDAGALRKMLVVFGAFGAILASIILHRYYKSWCERRMRMAEVKKLMDSLAEQKLLRERNGNVLPEVTPDRLCVVCQENPREVLILECGHLCVCVRCGNLLEPRLCPVCRAEIVRMVPAFVP